MARFGTFKYGEELYGPSGDGSLGWGIKVDWDEDGYFISESSRMKAFECFRGRRSFLNANGDGFAEIETGTMRITLHDYDGRFDGWNTHSDLYPHVMYGKNCFAYLCEETSGGRYPLFRGVIENIECSVYGESPEAVISVVDGWRWLRDYPARMGIQADIRVDEAMDLILDAVDWPEKWGRNLGIASDTIPYWWASGNNKAADDLNMLVQSYLGYFFIDANGAARFKPRNEKSDATADFTQENTLKDIKLDQPWAYNRNITRVRVHPRTAASSAVIWTLGEIVSIAAGASLTIWAEYNHEGTPGPAENVITPVATTDYLLNSQNDGGGTNLTASCSVSLTDFGDTAKLVVTNGSGSTGYLMLLQIRGDAIYELDPLEASYPADTAGITMPREFIMDMPWQQSTNVAIGMADALGAFLAGQNAFPIIRVEANPVLQFTPELFDIVTLRVERMGINSVSFRIGGIEHRTTGDTCQNVVTTFYLEPYLDTGTYWTWPITNFGVDTVFGW